MVRKIYLRGGIGVGPFRKIYGGRKSNGSRPFHFVKASGSIARTCLKQLELLDIVEKDPNRLLLYQRKHPLLPIFRRLSYEAPIFRRLSYEAQRTIFIPTALTSLACYKWFRK